MKRMVSIYVIFIFALMSFSRLW